MCGFAGLISFAGKPVDPDTLRAMTSIAQHRGPDDQGLRLFSLKTGLSKEIAIEQGSPPPHETFEGGVGFNRLSILDLSPNGHQPMANSDGTIFIVFNGEVYNAFDYTKLLASRGYRFRGHSDTEVILYLYEEFGIEGCLERLNGMFAFAIVDMRKREIHVARDHLGIKPLYWANHQGTFSFASEAKSLLAQPGFPREVDESMLDEHLLFRYNAGSGYLMKHISQLRPGFRIKADAKGAVSVHQYYEIPDCEPVEMTDAQAMEKFSEAFERSVKSQLISDVKLGCQLSGGIDSSLVTSVARERFGQNMDAFSIIFADNAVSEEKWMRQAAEITKTTNHCYPLTFEFFFDHVRDATWHYDAPINLGNAVGLYLLSKEAKKHVTVLLSGDGADELMGGYPRFYLAALRRNMMRVMPLARHLPKIGPKLARNFDSPPGLDDDAWFIKHSSAMRDGQVMALRPSANLDAPLQRRLAMFREGKSTYLNNCNKFDMQTFMVELLIRQDKMMMAHSVENRVPMLDKDLVALARALPQRLRISDRVLRPSPMEAGTKVLLKKMAEKRFGYEFVHRRKVGFGLPLMDYFSDPRFGALLNDSLLPGITKRGWLDPQVIRSWHRQICEQRNPWVTEAMWSVVSLELWAQEFLDDGSVEARAKASSFPAMKRDGVLV